MSNNQLTEKDINETKDYLVDELRKDYPEQEPGNLNSPGLIESLTFIALKVLIPIFASVSGRFIYDKIKDWRKGKISNDEMAQHIAAAAPEKAGVSKEEVIAGIIDDLAKNNVSADKARELAEKVYQQLNEKK